MYTYAGNTEREIRGNQIEIGLGIYMKEKYNEYRQLKNKEKGEKLNEWFIRINNCDYWY